MESSNTIAKGPDLGKVKGSFRVREDPGSQGNRKGGENQVDQMQQIPFVDLSFSNNTLEFLALLKRWLKRFLAATLRHYENRLLKVGF